MIKKLPCIGESICDEIGRIFGFAIKDPEKKIKIKSNNDYYGRIMIEEILKQAEGKTIKSIKYEYSDYEYRLNLTIETDDGSKTNLYFTACNDETVRLEADYNPALLK